MPTLAQISQCISIYGGSFIFLTGVLGGLLNIIVFLSLRTFRESSCAFYLIVMSFVNIGNLLTGLLSRIIISGFGIDWTLISPLYCKFRWFCLQQCVLTSFTCTCLAALDQYMSTNARPLWRQWSNIKIAHRITITFIIVWLLHGISYLIFFDLLVSPSTGKTTCTSTSTTFRQYHVYGYLITLSGALPLITTAFFGSLAYNNVRQLSHRTVPLVRRELEKQLTQMVLAQIAFNVVVTLPYTILTMLTSILGPSKDPSIAARFDFATVMSILLYYSSFSVSQRRVLIHGCFYSTRYRI